MCAYALSAPNQKQLMMALQLPTNSTRKQVATGVEVVKRWHTNCQQTARGLEASSGCSEALMRNQRTQ